MGVDLDEAWPSVAAAIRRLVVARGSGHATADDVAQETFIRAVGYLQRRPEGFADDKHLLGWSLVTASNLVRDEWRRHTSRHDERDVPDAPDWDQPELRILARDVMAALPVAFNGLTEREREAVLSLFDRAQAHEPLSDADRKRLDRARTRLRRLLDWPVMLPIGLMPWLRIGRLHRVARRARSTVVLGGATLAAGLLLVTVEPSVPGVTDPRFDSAAPAAAVEMAAMPALLEPAEPNDRSVEGGRRHGDPPRPIAPRAVLVSVPHPAGGELVVGTKPNDGGHPLLCARGVRFDAAGTRVGADAAVCVPQPPPPMS